MTMDEPDRADQSTPWWANEVPQVPVVSSPALPEWSLSPSTVLPPTVSPSTVLSVQPAPAPAAGSPNAPLSVPPATGHIAPAVSYQDLAPLSGQPLHQDPSIAVAQPVYYPGPGGGSFPESALSGEMGLAQQRTVLAGVVLGLVLPVVVLVVHKLAGGWGYPIVVGVISGGPLQVELQFGSAVIVASPSSLVSVAALGAAGLAALGVLPSPRLVARASCFVFAATVVVGFLLGNYWSGSWFDWVGPLVQVVVIVLLAVGAFMGPGDSRVRGVPGVADIVSNGTMAPERIIGVVIGLLLVVAGLILGAVLLVQRTGPGGLCGSVFDQAGNGFAPCDDAITNQIFTAGLTGGFLALAGVVFVLVSLFVGRAARRTGG